MSLTIALVQHNFTVGFLSGNTMLIEATYGFTAAARADLTILSELAITGYPPEDLVLSRRFQELSMKAVEELALKTKNGNALLVGGLWCEGDALYNAAFLLDGGKIVHRQFKYHLPNYGVFDEKRVFESGPMPDPVEWRGIKLGLMICEDMWLPDVTAHLKDKGAELLICINASPYETGKTARREAIAARHAQDTGLPLVYVNQISGQDDLVFDGGSFAVDGAGNVCLRMQAFKEGIGFLHCTKQNGKWKPNPGTIQPRPNELESMYCAMVLGLRDFVNKNGYSGVVIGISGGIDSILSSVIAADALGGDKVHMIMLPSSITSRESIKDSMDCAKRIGAHFDLISIEPGIKAFDKMLKSFCNDTYFIRASASNQTRIRASLLMAISAQKKSLLLATSNKSELATGFMQLYGDMAGYYCVLKDIYKTTEYQLAAWRNQQSEVIPHYVMARAPSAETMSSQKDQDILPPYEILDQILFQMVEQRLSVDEVVAQGFERETVDKVKSMLFGSEYKRRQSAPGVKLTSTAFGRDRRYPISSSWRGEKYIIKDIE